MNPDGLRPFVVAYQMRDGTRGRVTTIAPSSFDALLIVLDLFGDDLEQQPRRISARPT